MSEVEAAGDQVRVSRTELRTVYAGLMLVIGLGALDRWKRFRRGIVISAVVILLF